MHENAEEIEIEFCVKLAWFLVLHDEGRVFDIFLWLILELIEAKITGCFDLLDEESKLPTPRAEHFTSEVHNRNKGHPRLDVKEEIL